MPDEPQSRTFNRTDGVALKEHLEGQISALRCFYDARFVGLEKAIGTSERRLDERLASMNEFRSAMGDLGARMVTRTEMAVQLEKIAAAVDDLKQFRDRLDGKASQQSVTMAQLMGMAGLLLGLVSLVVGIVLR
ncbi:MAG: hypothetical protein EHM35_00435 [Planctomycetaceae bacterium]|nr:MAG: hypothetical protein EHM35_00435 [Planctomycetaceae bacterium]